MKKKEKIEEKQFTIKAPLEFYDEYQSICRQVGINMSQRIRILLEKDLKTLTEILEKSV